MIKIYTYETLENAYGVWSNEKVYSLIVDDKYYYSKHQHRGILQTSLKTNQLMVASLVEADLADYISQNNLKDIKTAYEVWHEEDMTIQIIFTAEKQAEFILDHKDFLEKIQMAELPVVIENGFVYVYANFILEDDIEKLENPKYEIIIKNK
jgi:hypothetical protein